MIVPAWLSCRMTRSAAEAADAPVARTTAAQAESRTFFMTIFLLVESMCGAFCDSRAERSLRTIFISHSAPAAEPKARRRDRNERPRTGFRGTEGEFKSAGFIGKFECLVFAVTIVLQ